MADAPANAPAGLAAFNTGFEHRTGYEWQVVAWLTARVGVA